VQPSHDSADVHEPPEGSEDGVALKMKAPPGDRARLEEFAYSPFSLRPRDQTSV
jgi:hypothetical protein